ncbi:hypothetical protein Pelo_6763 [Pelomyxa schiedti]|nr:hypothetical protein Pelo_6763 [Pelomyxa schiedti]
MSPSVVWWQPLLSTLGIFAHQQPESSGCRIGIGFGFALENCSARGCGGAEVLVASGVSAALCTAEALVAVFNRSSGGMFPGAPQCSLPFPAENSNRNTRSQQQSEIVLAHPIGVMVHKNVASKRVFFQILAAKNFAGPSFTKATIRRGGSHSTYQEFVMRLGVIVLDDSLQDCGGHYPNPIYLGTARVPCEHQVVLYMPPPVGVGIAGHRKFKRSDSVGDLVPRELEIPIDGSFFVFLEFG